MPNFEEKFNEVEEMTNGIDKSAQSAGDKDKLDMPDVDLELSEIVDISMREKEKGTYISILKNDILPTLENSKIFLQDLATTTEEKQKSEILIKKIDKYIPEIKAIISLGAGNVNNANNSNNDNKKDVPKTDLTAIPKVDLTNLREGFAVTPSFTTGSAGKQGDLNMSNVRTKESGTKNIISTSFSVNESGASKTSVSFGRDKSGNKSTLDQATARQQELNQKKELRQSDLDQVKVEKRNILTENIAGEIAGAKAELELWKEDNLPTLQALKTEKGNTATTSDRKKEINAQIINLSKQQGQMEQKIINLENQLSSGK